MCKVPHLKSLKVGTKLEFAKDNTKINEFLSDFNDQKHPNMEWFWNVLNTVLGERFKGFIQAKQDERTESMMEKRQMKIRALAEFIKLFKDLRSTSTQNCRSHFLIKILGNQKWENHTKSQREKLDNAAKDIENLNFSIEKMEEKLAKLQDIRLENNRHQDKLAKLYELELIDRDGDSK